VPDIPAGGPPPVPIEFGSLEWQEEVERYDPRSPARTQARSARKAIEAGKAKLDWKRCKADGPGRTKLPDSLAWNLIAFGERHPTNERTRNVYERAHKRLHGRYP
jgi:hypothetical protein